MTEELKLPEGLQLACEFARAVWPVAGTSAEKREAAIAAIRAEHEQRITLQQRVAKLEAERDELSARLAEIEAQAVSAMTREDAALLCDEVSSDLICAMLREGYSQDEARSLTAAARLCASELRSGYSAYPEVTK